MEQIKAEFAENLSNLKDELAYVIDLVERGEAALRELEGENLEKAEGYLKKAFAEGHGKYSDVAENLKNATRDLSSLEGDLKNYSR